MRRKNRLFSKLIVASLFLLCLAFVTISGYASVRVSADGGGWIGDGSIGGGTGGNCGSECGLDTRCYSTGSNLWRFQNDCAGWSWVKYKIGDDFINNKTTTLELFKVGQKNYPKDKTYGYWDEGVAIANVCAESGFGYFWHSGINGLIEPGDGNSRKGFRAIDGVDNYLSSYGGLNYSYSGDFTGSYDSAYSKNKNLRGHYENTDGNGWGHWATITPSSVSWMLDYYKSSFKRSENGASVPMNYNGTHKVYIGGKLAWQSVKVSDGYGIGSDAYNDYVKAWQRANNTNKPPSTTSVPTNVYAFCAGNWDGGVNTLGGKALFTLSGRKDGKAVSATANADWDKDASNTLEIEEAQFGGTIKFQNHRWTPTSNDTIDWASPDIGVKYYYSLTGTVDGKAYDGLWHSYTPEPSHTQKSTIKFKANEPQIEGERPYAAGPSSPDPRFTINNHPSGINLRPGESVKICEKMEYPWKFGPSGIVDNKTVGTMACITVKRIFVKMENSVDTMSLLRLVEANKTSNAKSVSSDWDKIKDNTNTTILETTSSKVNLEFTNSARRTEAPFKFAASVPVSYYYKFDGGSWNAWPTPLTEGAKESIEFANGVTTYSLQTLKNDRSTKLAISLNAGDSKSICVKVVHKSKVNNYTTSPSGTNEESGACMTVKRINQKAQFDGKITITASEDKTGGSSISSSDTKTHRLEVNTETYKVSVEAQMKRTGGNSGWSATSSWSTKAEKDNSEGDLSKGKNQSGSFTKDKASGWETLKGFSYPYTTTSGGTGKIYPGQEVTYCETLSYKSQVSENGKEDGDGTAKACLTIYRPKVPCSTLKGSLENAVFYSYMEGFNYGQIGVKNNTAANKNIAKDTYVYPEGKYGNGTISIYARPGDNIKYEHNLCAGGYYTLAMRKLGGKTTYTPSGTSTSAATNKGNYLFGEELSTWNETSKKSTAKAINFLKDDDVKTAKIEQTLKSPDNNSEDYKNCGTGGKKGFDNLIGTTAAAEATSCSGKINRIQTLDVGHTISQTLTWTQKGYKDGATTSGTDLKATGKVVVPYNYVLQPYVQNDSSSEAETRAFIGGEVNMTPGVVVLPRKNTAFADGYQEYATITKETHIRVKSYALHADGSKTDLGTTEYAKQRLNQAGNLNGTGNVESSYEDGGRIFPTVNIPIYDDNFSVGDKVCVEVSVYPFDSHDTPLNSIVSGATAVNGAPTLSGKTPALMEGSTYDSETRRLEFSCVTVAKRPTMSVESSNAYSATTYNMSQYNKRRNVSDTSKYNFGSWSEYGVYGRVQSGKMFASGAALGYSRAVNNSTRSLNPPRAQTSNGVSRSGNSNDCTFMTQTFANIDTSGNVCKGAQTEIGGVTATQYAARIKERYASTSGIDITKYSSYKSSYAGGTVWSVKNVNEAAAIQKVSGIVSIRAGSDGTGNTLFIDGTPAIYSNDGEFANRNVQNRNRTIVYRADNVIIDSNVNVDTGNKQYLRDINNVVIIAQNVYITNKPTYINATIIASKSLNTCKYTNGREMVMGKASGNQLALSSQQCSQQLVFDGPVVVNGKLTLNRTHGAGKGDNSIVRGEVFNLNSMNYLWSFGQMSRNSQAVTTYSRELPPRY